MALHPYFPCSSSSSSSFRYDVFISFRAPDTRRSFTDHLYRALCEQKINTFYDDRELQRGEEIASSLAKAIEECMIAIPVFSRNYASFDLDELAKIVKCSEANGPLVFPVFYEADTSHLRYQRGSYGEAKAKHEERFKGYEMVEKWRNALIKTANLSGYDFTGCWVAQENADPGVQNQGEEKPQVLLDALEYSRIWLVVYDPSCDRKKCDSALSEVGHSSLEKAHSSRTLWGARSEQQLGSNKVVCQDLGDKIWRLLGLSSMRSLTLTSKYFQGKRVSTTHQSGLMLLRDPLKHGQNYSPSLQTETNLWRKLNILPSGNHFSPENEESSVAVGIDLKMEAKNLDGKMTSEKLDYSSDCNLNKHKETMPKDYMFQPHDTFNQQKCKETTKRASAFVILAIVCIWFLLQTCSQTPHKYSVPTLIHVQPLHKERSPLSIGVPLIGLFGFMAFVWAAAMMILVGAPFTRVHSAVFIFWAILMHVRPSTFQYSEYLS